MQVNRTPRMGNIINDITSGIAGFLAPKQGPVIQVPGTPAALSMPIVMTLAGAVVLVAVMKKKGAL